MSRNYIFVVLILLAQSCGSKSNKIQTPISEDQGTKENITLTDTPSLDPSPEVAEIEPKIQNRMLPEAIIFRGTTWLLTEELGSLKLKTTMNSLQIERQNSDWLKLECDKIEKVIEQSLYTYEDSCKVETSENFRSCQLAASSLFFAVKRAEHFFRPSYPFDMVDWDEDTWLLSEIDTSFDENYIEQLKKQVALEIGVDSSAFKVDVLLPDLYFGGDTPATLEFTHSARKLDYKRLQDMLDRFAKDSESFTMTDFSANGKKIVTKNRLLSCDLINQNIFLSAPAINGGHSQSKVINIYAKKELKHEKYSFL